MQRWYTVLMACLSGKATWPQLASRSLSILQGNCSCMVHMAKQDCIPLYCTVLSVQRACHFRQAAKGWQQVAQRSQGSQQHAPVLLNVPSSVYRDPAAVVHLAKKFADLDAIPAIKTHFLGKSIFTAKDEEALLSLLDDADDSVAKALIALLLDRAVCKLEVSSTCTLLWETDQTSPA